MALSIPLSQTLPYYKQSTVLDNVNYIFQFKFNSREQAWYMEIRNQDNEILLSSIKLLPGFDLFRNHKHKNKDGLFLNPIILFKKNTPSERVIGLNNMGLDYELLYLEEGEF